MWRPLTLALAAVVTALAMLYTLSARADTAPVESALLVKARDGDLALKALVLVGCYELRKAGHDDICHEWSETYADGMDGYLERMVLREDLGDHEPLSQWVAMFTAILELYLGPQVMSLTHLDDLKILNYGIPVVFSPEAASQWCVETSDKPCVDEYRLHFVPFSGVCAYWGAYLGCVGATWGGGVVFICTPVGMAAEYATVKWVAPRLSDRVYARANQD